VNVGVQVQMQSLSIVIMSTCSIVHANEPAGLTLIKAYPQLHRELLQVCVCISVDWERIQVPKVGQINRGPQAHHAQALTLIGEC
jgi:hypothetical protein